jgi:hypothetical protein
MTFLRASILSRHLLGRAAYLHQTHYKPTLPPNEPHVAGEPYLPREQYVSLKISAYSYQYLCAQVHRSKSGYRGSYMLVRLPCSSLAFRSLK